MPGVPRAGAAGNVPRRFRLRAQDRSRAGIEELLVIADNSRSVLVALAICAGIAACGPLAPSVEGTVTVFAATSLTAPFEAGSSSFQETFPALDLTFQFAGSQQLRTQLEEGAQADVFASADEVQMRTAVASGLVDSGQVRSLSSNQLVVVLAEGNPAEIETIADLARPGLKLALADPSVPVGNYTSEFLSGYAEGNGLGPDFAHRVLVNAVSLEQSVGGVGTKVVSGEVDAGVVYRTDAISGVAAGLAYLEVPTEWTPPILYVIAPLLHALNPSGADAFVRWIITEDGQAMLAEFGFLPPPTG